MQLIKRLMLAIVRWFDSQAGTDPAALSRPNKKHVDMIRVVPFAVMHLTCLLVIWVGVSWVAVAVAVALYWVRMFAITGFYHRYFSHRSFRANRFMTLCFGILGNSSAQRGPLWWASHHRRHHQHSDEATDVHSPRQHGFFWSHMGWILNSDNFPTDEKAIKDFAKYPELRFLDRFDALVPVLLFVGLFLFGWGLEHWAPSLHTTGWQMLTWGMISTVILFHCTCFINSLAHVFGNRRFPTSDDSRNSLFLALLTLGEGWHNNHHHYALSTRQGFYWWELDITYYILRAMAAIGLIHDLKPVPKTVLAEGRALGQQAH
jgi:stearoyl-CoA desaturase (Delta-9 desaturase)